MSVIIVDSLEDSDPLFRCSSHCIQYDSTPPIRHHISYVRLKQFSESCSFIQCNEPLTPSHPYFTVTINGFSAHSKITVGISGPDFRDDLYLGCFNNTIGYHSDSGVVLSSHCSRSQSRPPSFGVGDTIGLMVTRFGESVSCVTLTKNGRAVCTKYHYEKDHLVFLPTITLEHGVIDLSVKWPKSFKRIPSFHNDHPEDWIVMPGYEYNSHLNWFASHTSSDAIPLCSIQAPQPLTKGIRYYEVEVVEIGENAQSGSLIICLVSPGALVCAPSSSLYSEVLKFTINTKIVRTGHKLGWGVHYLEPIECGDGLTVQPLLCCVALNGCFQTSVCYLEPEGGYHPFIAFTSQDFKLRVKTDVTKLPFEITDLHYEEHYAILKRMLSRETQLRGISLSHLTYSPDLDVKVAESCVTLTLPADRTGVHTFQYRKKPLTRERPVYQVNITSLSEDSVICIGLAGEITSCHKHPGRAVSSLGYHSRDGKILYDGRSQANTVGHRFTQGDQVMIEACFLTKDCDFILVRLWKNELPVALRYIQLTDAQDIFPTLSLFANGGFVSCEVITPNRIEALPTYFVSDPVYWCLPENAHLASGKSEVYLRNQAITGNCLVSPVPMSRGFHHFEVTMLEDPCEAGAVPPMIALTTASPYDPPRESNFKLDLLRFWPRNEAASLVRKGDTVGWGVVFPNDDISDAEEQIVVCYLTINRDVILTRALIQPAGGLFATVVLPYGCDRVQLNFGALTIHSHPFTKANVQRLYDEAKALIEEEEAILATGTELPYEHNRLKDFYRPLPDTDNSEDRTPHSLGYLGAMSGVETADHDFIKKNKSKSCSIL